MAQLPAFPGAEGLGSATIGGRGGQIIEVTNLNDNGPGSFREAVETAGPRIVIFRTGGIIQLESSIEITEPLITIAGQTAPGDGIMFRDADIKIQTNDVILRGIRVRIGDENQASDWDGILIQAREGEVFNVIVDHCSVSWSIDEALSTIGSGGGIHDITFSWNIVSEALHNSHHSDGSHSKGMLLSKNDVSLVSVHHNLFAHNDDRNPKIGLDVSAEVVSNVVYNFRSGTRLDPGAHANVIGNLYKVGLDTEETQLGMPTRGVSIAPLDGFPDIQAYVLNNIGPGRETNTGDEWLITNGDDAQVHRSFDPVAAFTPSGITSEPIEDLMDVLLDNVGALAPHRDLVDERVIQSVIDCDGRIIDSQDDVGGWPTMNEGTAPADTDGDGMPDTWENDHGLDLNDPSDGNTDRLGDGYTNVEEYINSLFDTNFVTNSPPTISDIADQEINLGESVNDLAFIVNDAETPADQLTVSATSSNANLVTADDITFGGGGTDRTISIVPVSEQAGNTTITVTVFDGSKQSSTTFALTVIDPSVDDQPPTISAIADQVIEENMDLRDVNFSVDDDLTPADQLIVSAVSSDQPLVADGDIDLFGMSNDRTLELTPQMNQAGTLTITVTVVDSGGKTASESFELQITEVGTSGNLNPHNVFSPNGDSVDDFWEVGLINQYPEYQVTIFNRYGTKVFEAKPYLNDWDGTHDGKHLSIGAYYFVITKPDGDVVETGAITLIR